MTPDGKKLNFNIFHILSAGDKELVHSSMLKFLIEESSSFREKFLVDEYPELYIKLEISDTVSDNNRNKRLRFDLLGYDKPKDGKLLFAIENKFKATPSVHQLELYDRYFAEQKVLKNKNPSLKTAKQTPPKVILAENFKKYLLVFSEGQIPSDVRKYCEDPSTEWVTRYFLSFEKENTILLSFLQNQTFDSSCQNSKKILIKEYKEYLESIHEILYYYVDSENYYPYYKILEKETENPIFAPRFIGFQYLLHIQALISEGINQWIDYSKIKILSSNDGGSHVIPSVSFWLNNTDAKVKKYDSAYFAIDGDTIKIGFLYKKANSQETKILISSILLDVTKYQFLIETSKATKLKELINDELDVEKMNSSQSVCSIYTFKAKEGETKDDVVNNCISLAIDFFTIIGSK